MVVLNFGRGFPNMKREYADIPEGQMHYIFEGEGEPLVLLHQGCRSSRMYVKLIPLLSMEHRVFALDLMGCGNSDAIPPEKHNVLDRAQNVRDFLDAVSIERCHIFGVGTGAALGAELAAAWPNKVQSLILFGFPFIRDDGERRQFFDFVKRTTGTPVENMTFDWLPKVISPDGSHLTVIWARVYSEVLKYWLHSKGPWAPDGFPNPLQSVHRWTNAETLEFMERWTLDYLQQMHGPLPAIDFAQRATGATSPQSDAGDVLTYDFKPRLPLIQAPTLVIDTDSPYEIMFCHRNQEVQKLLPDSKAVALPDSDGNAAEFRALQLAQMIRDFVRQHQLQPA